VIDVAFVGASTSAWGSGAGALPDGKVRIQVHDDVRGDDVYVVQPTGPPVGEPRTIGRLHGGEHASHF
jgi:hypothetical protein